MADRDPAELLPLTPALFHVLLSLADGEKHGYAILKEVEQRTDGSVVLSTGTLYGIIKRLLADGMIRESAAGQRRATHRASADGIRPQGRARRGRAAARTGDVRPGQETADWLQRMTPCLARPCTIVCTACCSRLFPLEFRGDFGDNMSADFRDQQPDALRRPGSMRRLWARTILDLLRRAPREHLDVLSRDASYAVPCARRHPLASATAILSLAIGIGLNSAVYSVVSGVLWRSLPLDRQRSTGLGRDGHGRRPRSPSRFWPRRA